MILQSLAEYYEELVRQEKVEIDGWGKAKISYVITIDADGILKGITSIMTSDTSGKKEILRPIERKVPFQKSRSRQISPNFLCDNAKYLLGAWNAGENEEENAKNRKQAEDYFKASGEYHKKILGKAECMEAKSICRFFEKWNFDENRTLLNVGLEELLQASNLEFRCWNTGKRMIENKEIQQCWTKFFDQKADAETAMCLVTGQRASIARTHPLVKGIRGAQSSGASLVSFNAPAFESYGKIQGANAPVSEYAANAYSKALNYLLSSKSNMRLLGETTVVFWSETGLDQYAQFMAEFMDGREESMEEKLLTTMDALAKGKPSRYNEQELQPDKKIYILCLSPNAARISVRFFYQDSFGTMVQNIQAHYKRMELIKPAFEKREYPTINEILYETVNKNTTIKQPQPVLVGALMRAVLEDSRYPAVIFSQIMLRIRADHAVNRNRVAMLKAYLIKNSEREREVVNTMKLNEDADNMAYTLGRIFAVLEYIQAEANPGTNTTIKDQYFNAACATPAIVFPRLLKLKNNHSRVLARDKKGMQVKLDKQLGELFAKIDEDIPKQLSMEEQGVFIIGYYHQLQKRFEKKSETNTVEEQEEE